MCSSTINDADQGQHCGDGPAGRPDGQCPRAPLLMFFPCCLFQCSLSAVLCAPPLLMMQIKVSKVETDLLIDQLGSVFGALGSVKVPTSKFEKRLEEVAHK